MRRRRWGWWWGRGCVPGAKPPKGGFTSGCKGGYRRTEAVGRAVRHAKEGEAQTSWWWWVSTSKQLLIGHGNMVLLGLCRMMPPLLRYQNITQKKLTKKWAPLANSDVWFSAGTVNKNSSVRMAPAYRLILTCNTRAQIPPDRRKTCWLLWTAVITGGLRGGGAFRF